ncbi:MAG: N-acetylmuramoyl-L-alanine amidase [Proteobacteria bacterium]|nr:N-acetylmuramoyl-L-alanine amidase [Pseudomonadota bacterium]
MSAGACGASAPYRPDPRPLLSDYPSRFGRPRIVLDAGHGGSQSGAVRSWSAAEKDINLRVTLALADRLWAAGAWEVVLTRATDRTRSIGARYRQSNRTPGRKTAFVSIHANAGGGGEGVRRGTMVIWSSHQRPGARKRSERLAACVGAALRETGFPRLTGERMPIKKARRQKRHYVATDPRFGCFATATRRLGVLDHNRHPAVLVESHFLDNKAAVAAFQNDAAIGRFARALEVALMSFYA